MKFLHCSAYAYGEMGQLAGLACEVEKRLEEREQEVQKLQKVQKQSQEQSGELERLREVQKAFNQQNAEMARLRQEHAAATSQVERLQAEHSQMKEEILQKNAAMKEMQTKLQGMVRDSEEAGAEAVVKRLMNKVGLTDEVVRSEKVWVRLYRDAMERLQRMAAGCCMNFWYRYRPQIPDAGVVVVNCQDDPHKVIVEYHM
ncbi:unnamed protein product [Durusdinium trenchii]|uniref:Uncharacterized protein n=1 Tax=Durusdinium trenchii TaxID=1381693 RepID=A0ABP0MIH0_9DINO